MHWLFISSSFLSLSLSLFVLRRACVGLPPLNHMALEHKVPQLMAERQHNTAMQQEEEDVVAQVPKGFAALKQKQVYPMANGNCSNGTLHL